MTLPNLLERLADGAVVITPGDRADVLLGVLLATRVAARCPRSPAIVLTGGLRPPAAVLRADRRAAERPAGRAHGARHLRDGDARRRA